MKLKQKIIAIFAIIILLMADFLPIGQLAVATAVSNLEEQTTQTQSSNVEFNAYLEGKLHEVEYNISEEGKLFIELKVKESGYLKNGIVEFSDCNFKLNNSEITSEYIQKIENNSIYLKQINAEESVLLELPVNFPKENYIDSQLFDKVSISKLSGSYTNAQGDNISIQKEISNKIKWKTQSEPESQISGKITKYLPYKIEQEYGVLVQAKINSSIKENILPIKTTSLEIVVPNINSQKPDDVKVIANKTTATNGEKTGLEFKTENYTYNSAEDKLTINVTNGIDEQGKIAWKKGEDEYLVNFIYKGQPIYEHVKQALELAKSTKKTEEEIEAGNKNQNAIETSIQVNGTITTYGLTEKSVNINKSLEDSIQEEVGKLTDFSAETVKSISKGYIYANYAKTEEQLQTNPEKTIFEIIYKAQIVNPELVTEVKFKTSEEKLVENSNENQVGTNIIVSNIKVNEAIFNKMLGEHGQIEILSTSQDQLGIITSETEKDEQGNYTLNIEGKGVNELIIKTSDPLAEGTLEVKVEKTFKPNQSFSQDQMKTFTKMKVKADFEANTNNETQTLEIKLDEPVSKAEINIEESQRNLSTLITNENVKINVVLDTSSVQNALYKNPLIEIEMPEQVKNVNLKDVTILLDDELKIENKFVKDDNGIKYIILQLEGTQTKYENYENKKENNVITKGANIIITADIILDELASSSTEKMYLYYINENTKLYEKIESTEDFDAYGVAEIEVNIVAPAGVTTVNSVSEYDGENSKLTNIDKEILKANIETKAKQKTAKFEGIVINNYSNNIQNVAILGRLPFEGNENIDTGEDLGSNFTMTLQGPIKASGIDSGKIKIYYSTQEDAQKDSLNTQNSPWKENPTSYDNIKSYLIVITEEIEHGTQIYFNYEASIPANLIYNKSSYTSYKVYYTNQIPETKTSGIIGLTTGVGPEVEVKLSSEIPEHGNVNQNQKVNFSVEISNIGDQDLSNAVLNIPVPENTVYIEHVFAEDGDFFQEKLETQISIPIGIIKAKETKTINYILKMKSDYIGEVSNIVNLKTDNLTNAVMSNEYIINVIETKISLELSSKMPEEDPLSKGNVIEAFLDITPIKDIKNIIITVDIPQGIKINKVTYYDENYVEKDYIKIQNNQIIANIEQLKQYNVQHVYIELEIEDFEGEFIFVANASVERKDEASSNKLVYYVYEPKFEITQTSSVKAIKEKENIIYEFTVKNIGHASVAGITFEDQLPQGLSFEQLEYTYQNETKEVKIAVDNIAKVYWPIFAENEIATIKITANANYLEQKITEKEVTNIGSISGKGYEKIMSNPITTIIERNPELYGEETEGNDNQITDQRPIYKISGIAWLDENKNGQRESEEQILPGIEVILLKKENGQIVKNIQDGKEITTRTDQNGEYQFEKLTGGEYIVVFCYDPSQYNVTDFQKQNVNSVYNSDAVSMLVTLNGKQTYAGVTNTIKITNQDAQNIDIGLYIAQKFDLRLDKYITKITLNTPSKGVKSYNLNKSQLEKVEIKSREVSQSNIIIEYTIVVTNEGKIPGYARRIVDYLPKNTRFNSELNNDWYSIDNSGNTIYNASLQNTVIKPGESKEVKLILSTPITQNNIGTIINNNAEIYETYNEYGEKDIDSIEANMQNEEDDISKADIILSVATGTVIVYFTLALAIILIILIGVILIKRKFEKIN